MFSISMSFSEESAELKRILNPKTYCWQYYLITNENISNWKLEPPKDIKKIPPTAYFLRGGFSTSGEDGFVQRGTNH